MTDDDLARALGGESAETAKTEVKSTSKQTLRGPLTTKIEAKAVDGESVEEMKLRIRSEVLAELLAEQKGKKDAPAKEYVDFRVDLPIQASSIRIDGREFFHGLTYKVDANQAKSMAEIQGRAWAHENEVRGARKPFDPQRGWAT